MAVSRQPKRSSNLESERDQCNQGSFVCGNPTAPLLSPSPHPRNGKPIMPLHMCWPTSALAGPECKPQCATASKSDALVMRYRDVQLHSDGGGVWQMGLGLQEGGGAIRGTRLLSLVGG